MRKYYLNEDGSVVFDEVECNEKDTMWFEKRPLSSAKKQQSFVLCDGGTAFGLHYTGIGTSKFNPSNWTYYDNGVKYFRYKSGGRYVVYDANNVVLTRYGFYSLIFNMDCLSDGKSTKKKYKKIEKFLSRMLRDCVYMARGGVKSKFDYDDFEKEYRAIWAVRDACHRMFSEGKKLSENNFKKVFFSTSYDAKYNNHVYSFARYVRDTAKELIEFIAETDGKSEIDHSGSDEAGQNKGVLNA